MISPVPPRQRACCRKVIAPFDILPTASKPENSKGTAMGFRIAYHLTYHITVE